MEELQEDTLEQEVHHALQYLYDPTELRKNRLLSLLTIDGGHSPLTQLRRTLTDAIEALKPDSQVPPEAQAWRIYSILTYRFVERLSQRDVANDLCLSVRQLRRDEHAAIRVLIHHLRHRYGASLEAAVASSPAPLNATERSQELEWLRQTLSSETMDLRAVIAAAVSTAAPLTTASGVRVEIQVPRDLPTAVGQTVTTRQAILNLLSTAAPAIPGGQIEISVTELHRAIELTLRARDEAGTLLPVTPQLTKILAMSRQLVELGGGALCVPAALETCEVTFRFPTAAAQQFTVLIVDDNADTLQLFCRYLAGTRFEPVPVSVPGKVLGWAQDVAPDVIVLDVMLPNIDGWELLGRIREHPTTRGVPTMICTILPQEKLALALGADAFLQKPFTREALLASLTALVDPADPCEPAES